MYPSTFIAPRSFSGSRRTSEETAKGNRPSFSHAARPQQAEPLYEAFCAALEREGVPVARSRIALSGRPGSTLRRASLNSTRQV
jgi:hypothetical protein